MIERLDRQRPSDRDLWRQLEDAEHVRVMALDAIRALDACIAAAQAQLVPGALPAREILTVKMAAKLAPASEETVRDWCIDELRRNGADGWAHRAGARGQWKIDRKGFEAHINRAVRTVCDDRL